MNEDRYIKIVIGFGTTGIALGAIGAHLLKGNAFITDLQLESFETGVRYQIFHAIMILILVLNNEKFNSRLNKTLKIMILGICMFSFSIYLLCIQNIIGVSLNFLGILTPIGGLLLIYSWARLLFSFKKNKN